MYMTENTLIMQCPNCSAKNRVLVNKDGREAVCGRCKTPLVFESRPIIVTDQNFPETVESSSMPVLLDCWAAWCGPCRIIAPVIDALAKELAGRVRVGKLDVDSNQMTAARFRVQSIPTLLIIKNGHEVDRIVGAQTKEAILRRLTAFL
jgi:thioredoxin 2